MRPSDTTGEAPARSVRRFSGKPDRTVPSRPRDDSTRTCSSSSQSATNASPRSVARANVGAVADAMKTSLRLSLERTAVTATLLPDGDQR